MQQPFTGQTLFSQQTDCREPSHSHGYQFVSMYHIMMSSIHIGSFFRSLYFRGSRSVCENCENLHPAKISRYTVTVKMKGTKVPKLWRSSACDCTCVLTRNQSLSCDSLILTMRILFCFCLCKVCSWVSDAL